MIYHVDAVIGMASSSTPPRNMTEFSILLYIGSSEARDKPFLWYSMMPLDRVVYRKAAVIEKKPGVRNQ